MGELVLIRHGETEWSMTGRHTSYTDLPLTEHGEAQARSLAPLLASRHIFCVLTSPMQRARDTANELADDVANRLAGAHCARGEHTNGDRGIHMPARHGAVGEGKDHDG